MVTCVQEAIQDNVQTIGAVQRECDLIGIFHVKDVRNLPPTSRQNLIGLNGSIVTAPPRGCSVVAQVPNDGVGDTIWFRKACGGVVKVHGDAWDDGRRNGSGLWSA